MAGVVTTQSAGVFLKGTFHVTKALAKSHLAHLAAAIFLGYYATRYVVEKTEPSLYSGEVLREVRALAATLLPAVAALFPKDVISPALPVAFVISSMATNIWLSTGGKKAPPISPAAQSMYM